MEFPNKIIHNFNTLKMELLTYDIRIFQFVFITTKPLQIIELELKSR